MSSTITIHRSLLLNVSLAILLLSAAVLAATVWASGRLVQTLSQTVIQQSLQEMEAELQRFFAPATNNLEIVRQWGEAGMLQLDDTQALAKLLTPIMQQNPQLHASILADSQGRENLLRHQRDAWLYRIRRPELASDRARVLEWTLQDARVRESWQPLNYDPRTRPWYQLAIADPVTANHQHWTAPYRFFATDLPGITLSTAFTNPAGERMVFGFDVLLESLSDFTRGMHIGDHGFVFLVTANNRLIGLPANPALSTSAERERALLMEPAQLGIPILAKAARKLVTAGDGTEFIARFNSEGQAWWGASRSFPLARDQKLIIAVAIPETDLLGDITNLRLGVLGLSLAVLAFALWRAHRTALRYSQPIAMLARQSERIGRGDMSPLEAIHSDVVEIRNLASAQEQMRRSLSTLLKLERDMQLARQIQQSTLPAALPLMTGYQLAAWSEPAEETGGDIYDFIGLAHAPGKNRSLVVQQQAERVLMLLADATGHGIGPALSVTQVRAMLRMAVRAQQPFADIIREMNEQLYADLTEGRFITAWFGELVAQDHCLTSFSAGQAPLLHYVAASAEVRQLPSDAPPLGVLELMEVIPAAPINLGPGDIFAAISDGIFDARSLGGPRERFGTGRVCELIARHHQETPELILAALRLALSEFTGDSLAEDDCTAIIIKRCPEQHGNSA